MKNAMKQRWIKLCSGVSVSRALAIFEFVKHCYDEPGRDYHDFGHPEALLEAQEKYFPDAPDDEKIAVWFHDIFCLPGCPQNEEISAIIMLHLLAGIFPDDVLQLAATHIRSTKSHTGSLLEGSKRVCDLDLLSLASDPTTSAATLQRIRQEDYLHNEAEWIQVRIKFLNTLLAHPIYQTQLFQDKFEAAARQNAELERSKYPPST